jgi:DNA-binding NarL/FixJ family response regulator
MEKKVKILLAEGHTILREGLRALLSSDSNLEIVGDAEDCLKAVDCVEKLEPDLLLMDLSMPQMSGIEAIKKIKKRYPETKIIALTAHKNEDYLLATLQAGADGYVLKDATHNELVLAIKNVVMGESYFSPGASMKVVERYLQRKNSRKSVTSWETISPREREVLKLITEGYKNKEIAEDLDISIKTVEKHRESLMKKLDLHNAAALTIYAMEKGLKDQKI